MKMKILFTKSPTSVYSFICTALLLLLVQTWTIAQTFPGLTTNTAGNNIIPSTGTGGCGIAPQSTGGTIYNNTVAGLAAGALVNKVTINLTHTWDSDLEFYLQAPNGERIALSTNNGGSGDNFTNTVFMDGAGSITAGVSPFTGTYAPEGAVGGNCNPPVPGTIATLAAFTAAQNGVWHLDFGDSAGGDVGAMVSWSITFVVPAPFVPCVMTCPANLTVNLDPGACDAIVSYPLPTLTGDCFTGSLVNGFQGVFAPSAIN